MRKKILEGLRKNSGSRETICYVQSRNYIDWKELSKYPLPVNFVREFVGKVDWKEISTWQSLSENFIREFSDRF